MKITHETLKVDPSQISHETLSGKLFGSIGRVYGHLQSESHDILKEGVSKSETLKVEGFSLADKAHVSNDVEAMSNRVIDLLGEIRVLLDQLVKAVPFMGITIENRHPRIDMHPETHALSKIATGCLDGQSETARKASRVDSVHSSNVSVSNTESVVSNIDEAHKSSSSVDGDNSHSQSTGEETPQTDPNEGNRNDD